MPARLSRAEVFVLSLKCRVLSLPLMQAAAGEEAEKTRSDGTAPGPKGFHPTAASDSWYEQQEQLLRSYG